MNQNFKIIELAVTPTLDTGATSAGDVLCAAAALSPTLPGNGGYFEGELVKVTVLDTDDNGAALDVVLLRSETDLGTAGSAVSISDADAAEIVSIVSVEADDYVDLVASQRAEVECGRPIKLGSTLYLGLIDRTGSKTYTAGGLQVTLHVRADNPR